MSYLPQSEEVAISRYIDAGVRREKSGWTLVFKKVITLPFIPYYELGIVMNDEKEFEVKLVNNDFCYTTISWNMDKVQFDINVQNVWRRPVDDSVLDGVLEKYGDWERRDSTNVAELKELMIRNR